MQANNEYNLHLMIAVNIKLLHLLVTQRLLLRLLLVQILLHSGFTQQANSLISIQFRLNFLRSFPQILKISLMMLNQQIQSTDEHQTN